MTRLVKVLKLLSISRHKLKEAKRIEELLKIQINEKEESCCKLEAKIVDRRKKVEKVKQILE
jgi:hypothetical protein